MPGRRPSVLVVPLQPLRQPPYPPQRPKKLLGGLPPLPLEDGAAVKRPTWLPVERAIHPLLPPHPVYPPPPPPAIKFLRLHKTEADLLSLRLHPQSAARSTWRRAPCRVRRSRRCHPQVRPQPHHHRRRRRPTLPPPRPSRNRFTSLRRAEARHLDRRRRPPPPSKRSVRCPNGCRAVSSNVERKTGIGIIRLPSLGRGEIPLPVGDK